LEGNSPRFTHYRSTPDEDRGFISDWNWWVNDTIELIQHTMGEKYPHIDKFYIVGVSLGGAISLHTCLKIQEVLPQDLLSKWKGSGFLCPAVEQSLEPSIAEIVALELANSMGGERLALGPPSPIPVGKVESKSKDPYFYCGRMKLGLGFEARKLILELNDNRLNEVSFPYFLLHGDKDDVCPIRGAERLYKLSKTNEQDKYFHRLPDVNHYIMDTPEDLKVVTKLLCDWLSSRI